MCYYCQYRYCYCYYCYYNNNYCCFCYYLCTATTTTTRFSASNMSQFCLNLIKFGIKQLEYFQICRL